MTQGRTVGYARVSTDDQNLSLQLDALAQQGVAKEFTFTDKLSGAKDDRPGLGRCLTALQPGDTLVVWRLDRLGRSMRPLVTLMADLRNRGVAFRSVSDGMIDTTSPSGELVFHIFSALAQFERRLIQEQTGLPCRCACPWPQRQASPVASERSEAGAGQEAAWRPDAQH